MRSPLGLFGLDGKSRVGNLIDVGEQPFEPKGADFLLWGLVSLGMGGGTLPSPAQDFKRQSHDRSRGSTCSSQVQGQSARIKAGLGTASLAPRPLPPTRHTPASACPKTKCGLLVAESHVTGVVLVGEVMNAVRKHKQNDGGYPSMHVILCLAASLCLCPPAHHTPRVHTTHTLLASVQQLPPLHTFLLDRYFPTNEATDVFATTDVLVEYKKGSKKAAPFVAPRKGGITIMREGYTMKRFTPSYIAPKRPLTIDDLTKRGFGEALHTNLTPEQRQGVLMLGDLDELRDMNKRRKEAMAAEVIFTNACKMDEYVDDFNNFEAKEVFFYEGEANPAAYVPSANWDTTEAAGKQMLNDVAAMGSMLTSRGLPFTEVLMAPDVADVFLTNEWIIKLLDNRNYMIGGVNPEELPAGAAKIARLNIKGRMIDFIVYEDTYTEIDGTVKSFIPAGMIAACAPAAGRTVYGAITQLEQADGQFHTYAGVDVPKYISDATHNVREVTLTTAPLCMPNNENPFISAKVL